MSIDRWYELIFIMFHCVIETDLTHAQHQLALGLSRSTLKERIDLYRSANQKECYL